MFGLFVKKQVAVPDDTIVLTGTVERIGAANVSYDMLHFVLVLKEGATVHRFKTASWDIAEKSLSFAMVMTSSLNFVRTQ